MILTQIFSQMTQIFYFNFISIFTLKKDYFKYGTLNRTGYGITSTKLFSTIRNLVIHFIVAWALGLQVNKSLYHIAPASPPCCSYQQLYPILLALLLLLMLMLHNRSVVQTQEYKGTLKTFSFYKPTQSTRYL